MSKQKIAISLDKGLLGLIDSKVDGSILRSRSQAIEYFIGKGIDKENIEIAVLFLKGEHQDIALKNFQGKPLILKQLEFLENNNIRNIYILTQHNKNIDRLRNCLIEKNNLNIHILELKSQGNADALKALKKDIKQNFFAMSADIYAEFNIKEMINKHIESDKLATVGLMTRNEPSKYGAAILDGDRVIDFQEKPKITKTHVVNSGVYIFKPEIFELFEEKTRSLEKDILPKIARIKQLIGFFTYGEYHHFSK